MISVITTLIRYASRTASQNSFCTSIKLNSYLTYRLRTEESMMEIMSANTNNAILVTGICKMPILISFNFFTFIYLNLSILTKSTAHSAAHCLSSKAWLSKRDNALEERQCARRETMRSKRDQQKCLRTFYHIHLEKPTILDGRARCASSCPWF